jgi:hypothetical protein
VRCAGRDAWSTYSASGGTSSRPSGWARTNSRVASYCREM